MSSKPETIGILADLHCGSKWGLLSPDNAAHKQNVGQRYLWDCWTWIADNWPKLDLLILNGDLIDGCQPKSHHSGVLTVDYTEQAEMAEECIRPLCDKLKPKKIVRTVGTPYHEGHFGALKLFDERMGIPKNRVAEECDPIDIELDGGIILNAKHHPEGTAAMYVGSLQDKETLWATIAEEMNGLPRANILIRSHLHMSGRFDGCDKAHIMTPCFQLQSAYAKKTKFYRWHPRIGGVLLRREPLDDFGYTISMSTFKLPKRKAVTYEAL